MARLRNWRLGAILVVLAGPVFATAQPRTATIAGAWAGWIEVGANFQPIAAVFTPTGQTAGTIMPLLTGAMLPLASVVVEGAHTTITMADARFPVLDGTATADVISGVARATGNRTGSFRLIRTAAVDLRQKQRLVGAYRFSDGRVLLVDLGYPAASQMLYAIDAHSGDVRALYPVSATEFVAGPALLVPDPVEQRFAFETTGGRVTAVTRRIGAARPERAKRVELRSEEVRFRSGDAVLAGALVLPATTGRYPALVFAPSGGDIAREQFWGLGYFLAARGMAVLAFDKRGTGASTGRWRGTSFEELADDVVAGARFLQSRAEVDRARVGFWGLSQGAWIAPLAAVRAGDAAFVITMSGGGLTPAQGELLDSEYAMRVAGLSEQDVRDGLAFQAARDEFMRTGLNWDAFATRLSAASARPWWRLPGTDLSSPATADDSFWANTRRFYFYEPEPTLRRLRAPMLSIFGELDTPEGVTANIAGLTKALAASTHPDFTVRVFPNGRHNLMDLAGFPPNEYPRLRRFVPGLFETVTNWVESHVKR